MKMKCFARACKAILLALFVLSGCRENDAAGERSSDTDYLADMTEQEKQNSVANASAVNGENTVTWLIPPFAETITLTEEKLNEQLKEDGIDLSVHFETGSENGYDRSVQTALEDGTTDLVTFIFVSSEDFVERQIREGRLLDLTDVLETEGMTAVRSHFTESEWDRLRVDGRIYSISNQYGQGVCLYTVADGDAFSEEELQGQDGSLSSVLQIIHQRESEGTQTSVLWNEAQMDLETVANQLGYTVMGGCFVSLDDGEVFAPYECVEYIDFCREMNRLYLENNLITTADVSLLSETEGYDLLVGYVPNLADATVWEQDVIFLRMPYLVTQRLLGSVGVASSSANSDAALRFLTLLYEKPEYANILVYGQEGTDYQIEDGYVVDPVYGKGVSLLTGQYDSIYPSVEGDEREISHEKLYEEKVAFGDEILIIPSAISGFRAELTDVLKEARGTEKLLEKWAVIWQSEDLDAELEAAKKAFLNAGGEEVVDALQSEMLFWQETR